MAFSPFIRETADRVLKSAAQGYLASWLVLSGGVPRFDRLFTAANCQAAVVLAVLSLATAFGLRNLGSDRATSQVL